MTINLCLVTHDQLGSEMLSIVSSILDTQTYNIQTISIPSDIDAQHIGQYADTIHHTIDSCSKNADLLILCDLFGATPYNLVKCFSQKNNIKVISGLNIAMLLKAIQSLQEPLQEITEDILNSAKSSIIAE